MMRIFESLLEESNKKKFIKNWLGNDAERVEEYDEMYEKYKQVFDNEVKKRGLNWQTSMTLDIFEEILDGVNDRKSKAELKKQNKAAGRSAFLSYVLANPDCDLTYLGTLNKWDYFKIETWHGAMLVDSPKSSLHGNTGAKWCIGWNDPKKQRFDQYTKDGFDFVLIVKSDSSNKDVEEKYCIQTRRETGVVEFIWTPLNDVISDKTKISKILYGQEAKIKDKRISGVLKGIDIGVKEYVQPENKIVDIGNDEPIEKNLYENTTFYYKLYKSGTDQLIDGNDLKTLEFIDLKQLPKYFFQFARLKNVEKIIILDGLKSIGNMCFYNYDNIHSTLLDTLKYVELPDSVEVIGDGAFGDCKGLESIKIPANLRKIDSDCFLYCRGLTHIELPDTVEEIGDHAFYGCRNLEYIKIPDSITKIGDGAFEYTAIKDQSLIDKIERINKKAFSRAQ